MTHHTTEHITTRFGSEARDENLTVSLHGGSLQIFAECAPDEFILFDTIDGASDISRLSGPMVVAGSRFKFTPLGACEFNFGEGI